MYKISIWKLLIWHPRQFNTLQQTGYIKFSTKLNDDVALTIWMDGV